MSWGQLPLSKGTLATHLLPSQGASGTRGNSHLDGIQHGTVVHSLNWGWFHLEFCEEPHLQRPCFQTRFSSEMPGKHNLGESLPSPLHSWCHHRGHAKIRLSQGSKAPREAGSPGHLGITRSPLEAPGSDPTRRTVSFTCKLLSARFHLLYAQHSEYYPSSDPQMCAWGQEGMGG